MRSILCLLAMLLAAIAASAQQNIIVVIADDLGVDKVETYSALYPFTGTAGATPNIGALATNGIKFSRMVAEPSCSPFRAALLTGRHTFRNGVGTALGSSDIGLPTSEMTIADILKAAGYRTVAIGKTHLSGTFGFPETHFLNLGFDEHHGAPASAVPGYTNYQWYDNGVLDGGPDTYLTLRSIDAAIAELPPGGGSEPLFMWVAAQAPHEPFHCPPDLVPDLTPHFSATCGASPTNADLEEAMLEALDTKIGDLVAAIDWSDTCLIFVGDNGTAQGATEAPYNSAHAKGSVFQQGIRTPLIVRGNCVQGSEAGTVGTQTIQVADLAATILDLAGLGDGLTTGAHQVVDGISIKPYLTESSTATIRKTAFAQIFEPTGQPHTPTTQNLRRAEYDHFSRVRLFDGTEAFYDFAADPHEASAIAPGSMTAEQRKAYDILGDIVYQPYHTNKNVRRACRRLEGALRQYGC